MKRAATILSLAAFFFGFAAAGCRTATDPRAAQAPSAASPEPAYTAPAHALVGHVLAIDRERGFVIVALADDPPAVALRPGVQLWVRRRDLRFVARLSVSRYLRGDTLGTTLVEGEAAIDDEVVVQARASD
jgi:hypothetical protein